MNYTVVWMPTAEDRLAQAWIDAADRPAVTAAANEMDALLRRDPAAVGESRGEKTRLLIVPPLIALFEVEEEDRLVRVLKVWTTDEGS